MATRKNGQEPAQAGNREMEPMDGQKGKTDPDPKGNRIGKGGISGQQEIVLMAELNRTGVALDDVLERYEIDGLDQMTPEIYKRAMGALKQTRPKGKRSRTAA